MKLAQYILDEFDWIFNLSGLLITGLDNNINNNDYYNYYYYCYCADTTAIRPITETAKEHKK